MVVTQFGKTVALDSNTLAVSAPGDYGTSQGSCTSGYWVGVALYMYCLCQQQQGGRLCLHPIGQYLVAGRRVILDRPQ